MLLPIDKTIRDLCTKAGDTSYKHYTQWMRSVVAGYKDVNLFVIPTLNETNIASELLDITPNKIADLPNHLIYITQVGICVNGRVAVLSYDPTLCGFDLPPDANCDCGVEEMNTTVNSICCCGAQGVGTIPFYNTWYNGAYLGEMYGAHGGYSCIGYWSWDKKKNRILINSLSILPEDAKLIVQGKFDDSLQVVSIPSECEEAVKKFAVYDYYEMSNPSLSRNARREYLVEYERLKKLYQAQSIEEWHRMLLRNTTSTVKR